MLLPVLRVNRFGHQEAFFGTNRLDAINSRCFLPLVLLCYPTNCQEPCCPGFHHQFLEFMDCSPIATLFGSKDALLYAVDMLLECAPGQLVPTLTLRVKWRFPLEQAGRGSLS